MCNLRAQAEAFSGSNEGDLSEREQKKEWAIRTNLGARALTIASAQSRYIAHRSFLMMRKGTKHSRQKSKRRSGRSGRNPISFVKALILQFGGKALTIASAQSCCDAPDAPDRSDTPPAMTVWSWVSADRTCDRNTFRGHVTWPMKTNKHVSSDTIWTTNMELG
jgi:hypothetical protein